MIQFDKAMAIVEDKKRAAQWKRIGVAMQGKVIDLIVAQDARRDCCMPYDCMCHEVCYLEDGVENRCLSCQHIGTLNKITKHLRGDVFEYADAWLTVRDHLVSQDRLAEARDLEAAGDYAGAERLLALS